MGQNPFSDYSPLNFRMKRVLVVGDITSLLESMTFSLHFGQVSLENNNILPEENTNCLGSVMGVGQWNGHTDWYNGLIKDRY